MVVTFVIKHPFRILIGIAATAYLITGSFWMAYILSDGSFPKDYRFGFYKKSKRR